MKKNKLDNSIEISHGNGGIKFGNYILVYTI